MVTDSGRPDNRDYGGDTPEVDAPSPIEQALESIGFLLQEAHDRNSNTVTVEVDDIQRLLWWLDELDQRYLKLLKEKEE